MLTIAVLSAGCNDLRLDGETEATLERSFERLLAQLPDEQTSKVANDFYFVRTTMVGHSSFTGGGLSGGALHSAYRDRVDGMNAEDLAAEAERLRQAWRLADLLEVRKRVQDFYAARSLLAPIAVIDPEIVVGQRSCQFRAGLRNNSTRALGWLTLLATWREPSDESRLQHFDIDLKGLMPGQQTQYETDFGGVFRSADDRATACAVTGIEVTVTSADIGTERIRIGRTTATDMDQQLAAAEAHYQSLYGNDEPQAWATNVNVSLTASNRLITPLDAQ